MTNNKIKTGKFGEQIAAKYLKDKGYKILKINYYTRDGEVDLICQKRGLLIFVEVKTRKNNSFGYPEESIDQRKQDRLVKAVQHFLQNYTSAIESIRIDAISVELVHYSKIKIKHFKDIIQDF